MLSSQAEPEPAAASAKVDATIAEDPEAEAAAEAEPAAAQVCLFRLRSYFVVHTTPRFRPKSFIIVPTPRVPILCNT